MSDDIYGLTFEDIDSKLLYDEETGKIYWKVGPAKNVRAGSEAGCVKTTGVNKRGEGRKYVYVRLEGRQIVAAQIVWMLTHGEWPKGRLAYQDGDTLNIRATNLVMSNSITKEMVERDQSAYMHAHRAAYPSQWKDMDLRRSYGISQYEHMKMTLAQGGLCAICLEEEKRGEKGRSSGSGSRSRPQDRQSPRPPLQGL